MRTCSFNGTGRRSNESAEFLAVQTTAISPRRKSVVGAQASMRPKVCIFVASSPRGMKVSAIQDVPKEEHIAGF